MSSSITPGYLVNPSYFSNEANSSFEEKKMSSKEGFFAPNNVFLRQVSTHFFAGEFQEAIDALFRLLTTGLELDLESDIEETYQCIFLLLGHFANEDLKRFEESHVLDSLLNASKKMPYHQSNLCYLLGKQHEENAKKQILERKKSNSDCTLHEFIVLFDLPLLYYSKAITLQCASNDTDSDLFYRVSNKILDLFNQIVKYRLFESFSNAIRSLDFEKFQAVLDEIELLKALYCTKDQATSFYNEALDAIARIQNTKTLEKFKERFCTLIKERVDAVSRRNDQPLASLAQTQKELSAIIGKDSYTEGYLDSAIRQMPQTSANASSPYTAKGYRRGQSWFRERFPKNIGNVRVFQKEILNDFKTFFQVRFIDVAFEMLGPPPCSYDIRAMGSIGKEEMCPYSDLEYFILIEKDSRETRDYFKSFAALLRQLLILLDETPELKIVFKCHGEKNFSGFKIDAGGNPSSDDRLIGTPEQIAQMIKPIFVQVGSIENTLLKSASLKSSNDSLFTSYQRLVDTQMSEKDVGKEPPISNHKRAALNLMKERLRVYKISPVSSFDFPYQSVNVKEFFLEPISHLMRDLSIYFGCSEINTLDIFDALIDKKILSFVSGCILKESIGNLYRIRVRLHQESRCQNELWEEVALDSVANGEEKLQLQKMHQLIVRPLYNSLEKALRNEQEFEKLFQDVDLIKEGFDELLQESFRKNSTLFIKLAVKALIHNMVSEVVLKEFYQFISSLQGTDNLREIYLQVLGEYNPFLTDTLSQIPSLGGLRMCYSIREKQLQKTIEEITTEEDTGVQIQWGNRAKPLFLKQYCIDQILDEKGDIKDSYPGSMHRVARIIGEKKLHFKQFPAQPLMEYAIGNLYARVAGLLTPAVELACLTVKHGGESRRYPVLISQTIEGRNLKEASVNSSLQSVNWDSWSSMLLCSILSLPGDGRLSNYILDPKNNVWCIDNDIAFVEPLVQDGYWNKQINFCSALFCVFQQRPLSKKALEVFCYSDGGIFLNEWLIDVIRKDKECHDLFTSEETDVWLHQEKSFKSTILLRQGVATTLHLQFWRLQSYIKDCLTAEKKITPIDLLGQIISLKKDMSIENPAGRFIASIYQKNGEKGGSIDQTLSKIVARSVEQSLTSFQSDKACLDKAPSSKEIKERALFSPEKARDELLVTMISQVFSGNDGLVYTGSLNRKEVLQGNFKDLSEERQTIVLQSTCQFSMLSHVKPKAVILHHCDVLDSASLSAFLHKDLEYLELSFCKKIKGQDFGLIADLCPHLRELHIVSCPAVENIKSSKLFTTTIVFSSLETLKIASCENLVNIYVAAPNLQAYVLKNNPKLSWIDCSNISLQKVKLTGSQKLCSYLVRTLYQTHGILMQVIKSEDITSVNDWWNASDFGKRSIYDPSHPYKLESFLKEELSRNPDFDINQVFVAHPRRFYLFAKELLVCKRDVFGIENVEGDTLLIIGARQRLLEVVKQLVEKGCHINHKNFAGDTVLHVAARSGFTEIIEYLTEKGADASLENNEGDTPFMLSVLQGEEDALDFMLKAGAPIDHQNRNGETALMRALSSQSKTILSFLLNRGASVNLKNHGSKTALMIAAMHRDTSSVGRLLNSEADTEIEDWQGNTALMLAIKKGEDNLDVMRLLLDHKANVNHQNVKGHTAAMQAAFSGSCETVQILTQYRAHLHIEDYKGNTALFHGIKGDSVGVVDLLLEYKSYVDHQNKSSHTPLMYAASSGALAIMRKLMKYKANVHALDDKWNTALFYAVASQNVEGVNLLIENGSEVNHKNEEGRTPLMYAATLREIGESLSRSGASTEILDKHGKTAFFYACNGTHLSLWADGAIEPASGI